MREPASVYLSEPEGPSCPCSPPGRPPRAPRLLQREPSVSGAQAWPRPPRGADATTHSARRPGRRSRGRSGRRPWRGHRGRAGGRRSPGCRRHRSARRGRLGRAAGGSASRHGRAGPRGRPLAHQPDAGRPGAHPPGCTGTRRPRWPATHPAHSVARSSPGRRSSCRRPRGRGPHSCRSTCAHSSRQTGSEDSLRTEAGHALGHVPPSSDTHAANASRALSGPVSAAWAHVYPGATPAGSRPFTHPLGQQRPGCPRAEVTQGKGASTLQELPEPARPVGGVWEPPWGGGTL